jgi:HlyD family secretion protein
MFRKKGYWIVLIIVILAVASGVYAYFDSVYSPAQAAAEDASPQTAPVRQGDIVVSATGAGSIIPAEEVQLSFETTGALTELLVQVGDEVQAGDVLARLDDTDALQAVANAEIQVVQAAVQTDPDATESGVSSNAINLQQAQIDLDVAQAELEALLNWVPDEDEITQAEAVLQAAQASYQAALGGISAASNSATVAQINREAAERDLATAQANYDNAWDEARDWETYWNEPICDPGEPEPCSGQTWQQRIENDRVSTANALARAQDNLAIAQANYNGAASGVNSSGSANAQSNILNAELALEAAQTGPNDEDLKAAETAVQQADLALQQAVLNQEIDVLNLAQAELNLEAAQADLAGTVLLAPLDGTIMSIESQVGENLGTSPIITLADLDQPLLEAFFDETDLDKVDADYEVEVVFDALPDDVFNGHVVQVDPQLSDVSGVTAVRAIVQLDADSFSKPQTLPVGLNATVEVIGGQAEGALIVPVEALREISPGEYAVFVMENGEPQLRMVEVGLMDYTYAEILSGLELGAVVTTGIVATQ